MAVYIIGENRSTKSMSRIHCKDEDKELQLLLEKNTDLIPGDQISPEDPRRWLIIKREMPVPDPNTGSNRWSIDFFLVDQDAVPTFVECKRFQDTRSRREVVGQMFEYAANGHYYWTKEMLQAYTEESALKNGDDLEEALLSIYPTDVESTDEFFEKVKENLREGQIRLVFFLEEAPMELRSVVDFLNKQMERSEVLLVEAKIYKDGDNQIVVPTLFGYTEEARRVKRTVTVSKGSPRKKWDKTSFFDELSNNVDEKNINAVQKIYNFCEAIPSCSIKWGTGAVSGSFSLVYDAICPRSIFSVWSSNGSVSLNFGWVHGSDLAEKFKVDFRNSLNNKLNLNLEENPKYPTIHPDVIAEKVDIFIEVVGEFISEG